MVQSNSSRKPSAPRLALGLLRKGARSGAQVRLSPIATALCILLFAVSATAQRFEARLFGQTDGLDNLAITALAQDPQGYLWVASQNGLFRYDGARYELFASPDGLTEASILTLLVDRRGTLWVGTHNGLFWFDGNAFHELQFEQKTVHVGSNSMIAATSSGEVIVAAQDIFSVEPEQSRSENSSSARATSWSIVPYRLRHPAFPAFDRNGIGVDASDRFWVGCGEAICGFRDPLPQRPGSGLETLGTQQKVPPDFYTSFFLARDGRMYARGRKNIVMWRPGDSGVTDLTGLFPPNSMKTVHRRFTEDAAGRILTPTASGFATWDGRTWFETKTTSQGEIDGASEVFADREGAIWIGTQGSGLLQSLGYGLWKNYGTAEGLSDAHVFSLATDRSGVVWAGHDKGASRLGPGTTSFLPSSLSKDEDASQIQALAASADGGVWVGALLGHIFHVNAHGAVDAKIAIDAYIRRLRIGPTGTVWVGTSAGLFTLDCDPAKPCKPVPVAGLENRAIRDLDIDRQGTIWALEEDSLDRIEPLPAAKTSLVRVEMPVEFKDRIKTFQLIAVAPDGVLWIASPRQGAHRLQVEFNSGRATAKVLESHPIEEFASTQVVSLDLDHTGRVWIGTDHGLNIIEHGRMQRITSDEGLIWNDIDSNAFMEDSAGTIWIGTSHGISHLLDPAAVFERAPFAAKVSIVQYNSNTMPLSASVLWDGGVTAFHFSGLTFRDNLELRYHYSLVGFDATPVITLVPFVRFQKLPPGTYTFRVVAEDMIHGVFSAPAEYTFTLTPPWWRTDGFYAVLAVIGCCLVALIWKWSQRVLIAQRNKLQRLVAERTYELEQLAVRDSLTGLLNRNAIMTALTAEVNNARKYKAPLCIALIDLDHFKHINDTYGHLAGDEVLRRSAQRLQGAIRTSDAIGRYGGEEFLIIFRNAEQHFGVDRCEVVRNALCAEPIVYESHSLKVTCSIGVAWSGSNPGAVNGLVARADQAMYLAKENGRNRTEYALSDQN